MGYSRSRRPDTCHGIQDSPVGDPILEEEDLPVEAGLQGVDVLPLPEPCHHHGRPDIDQEGASEAAGKLLDDVRLAALEPPLQGIQVPVYLFLGHSPLFLNVYVDPDPQVFHGLNAPDPRYLLNPVSCQDF